MENRYNIFDYCLIDSHVHNLNYTYKIISIILLAFCIVVANSIIDMVVINLFIFVVMLWSDISIRLYIKGLNVFKSVIFITFFVISFIYLNVFIGFIWALKVMDIILYISIITMTTSFYNIVYGIESLLKPFKGIMNVSDISLKIGMVFKFFSVMYSEYDKIKISKKLRGVRFSDMGFFDRLDSLVNGIVPLYNLTLRKLERLKNSMYVRNYGVSLNKANYRLNKWGKTDTIMLVINVIVVVIIFIY